MARDCKNDAVQDKAKSSSSNFFLPGNALAQLNGLSYVMISNAFPTTFIGLQLEAGRGLTDTGAQEPVGGETAITAWGEQLWHEYGLVPIAVPDQSRGTCGGIGSAKILSVLDFPAGIAGVNGIMRVKVLEEPFQDGVRQTIPILTPVSIMRQLRAQIGFDEHGDTLEVTDESGERHREQLVKLPSGHATNDLMNFDKDGWKLPRSIVEQLRYNPFYGKKQETGEYKFRDRGQDKIAATKNMVIIGETPKLPEKTPEPEAASSAKRDSEPASSSNRTEPPWRHTAGWLRKQYHHEQQKKWNRGEVQTVQRVWEEEKPPATPKGSAAVAFHVVPPPPPGFPPRPPGMPAMMPPKMTPPVTPPPSSVVKPEEIEDEEPLRFWPNLQNMFSALEKLYDGSEDQKEAAKKHGFDRDFWAKRNDIMYRVHKKPRTHLYDGESLAESLGPERRTLGQNSKGAVFEVEHNLEKEEEVKNSRIDGEQWRGVSVFRLKDDISLLPVPPGLKMTPQTPPRKKPESVSSCQTVRLKSRSNATSRSTGSSGQWRARPNPPERPNVEQFVSQRSSKASAKTKSRERSRSQRTRRSSPPRRTELARRESVSTKLPVGWNIRLSASRELLYVHERTGAEFNILPKNPEVLDRLIFEDDAENDQAEKDDLRANASRGKASREGSTDSSGQRDVARKRQSTYSTSSQSVVWHQRTEIEEADVVELKRDALWYGGEQLKLAVDELEQIRSSRLKVATPDSVVSDTEPLHESPVTNAGSPKLSFAPASERPTSQQGLRRKNQDPTILVEMEEDHTPDFCCKFSVDAHARTHDPGRDSGTEGSRSEGATQVR